jgi:hypothetical protein
VRVAPYGERHTLDQLHGEKRPAVVRRAAVQEAGDVGMLEAGEDLPFLQEPAEHVVRVDAALQNLDGDGAFELPVGAVREVDAAHASATDLPVKMVRTGAVPHERIDLAEEVGLGRDPVREEATAQEGVRRGFAAGQIAVRLEQRERLGFELPVPGAQACEGSVNLLGRQVHHPVEDFLEPREALRVETAELEGGVLHRIEYTVPRRRGAARGPIAGLTYAAGRPRLNAPAPPVVEGRMPEAGERGGGNRSVNVVAIVAILILVLLAVFALANRKPSDQVRKTTESSTKATPSKDSDIDIKVDVPDSVTISTD